MIKSVRHEKNAQTWEDLLQNIETRNNNNKKDRI